MTKENAFPVPSWVAPDQRQAFAVRLAALYHNPKGSLGALSEAIGLSKSGLHMALSYKGLNADHCIKLEGVLGRSLFPREFFRPDIFIAE